MFQNIREHKNLVEDLIAFKILKTNLFTDKNGIIWEGKNEFTNKNNLYDVVEIEEDQTDKGYVIVYAINDKQEENLVRTFDNLINELITEHSNNPKIRTILFNLISQALPKVAFSLLPVEQSYSIPFQLTLFLTSIKSDILTPPPKSA